MHDSAIPETIALELSSACNVACRYCDRVNWKRLDLARSVAHMDYDFFRVIVDDLAALGRPISLVLNYEGESLLHPRIGDMLDHCRTRGVLPWISTRLHPASPSLLRKMLESCSVIAASLDLPGVTLETVTRASTDSSAQVHNLEMLLEMRCEEEARIAVTTVLTQGDRLESPHVLAFIEHWIERVDFVYLYQGIAFGAERISYINDFGISEHLQRRRPCQQPFSYLAIMSDGRLAPCCNTSRVRLPTAQAVPPVSKIVGHPELQRFRQQQSTMDLEGTVCAACDLWIDDWLGDEEATMTLGSGSCIRVVFEGSAIRIERSGHSTR